jgi:hypothetical protein
MTMSRRAVSLFWLLLLCLTQCSKDPNESANALFVEAVSSCAQAANAAPDGAVPLYKDCLAKLDAIVTKYPSTTLAVQLASGQPIGDVSHAGIEAKLLTAQQVQQRIQISQGPGPRIGSNLSRGLIAYYPLNGNANDESGKGHSGIVHGNLVFVPGIFRLSAHFDGASAYISVPTHSDLDLQPPFSLAAWFNFEPGSACGSPRILHKESYQLETSGQGASRPVAFGIPEPEAIGPPVQSGNWTHAVGAYDDASLRLYLNGNLAAQLPLIAAVPRSVFDLAIGRNTKNGCDLFKGLI